MGTNQDTPNGFRCITPNPRRTWYPTDASKTKNIGHGDFVEMENDGNVIQATAGGLLLGLAVGFRTSTWDHPTVSGAAVNYMPAGTAGFVLVIDDPDAEFVGQTDGYETGTTPVAKADEGCNYDIAVADIDTTTGYSKMEIDADTNGTATAQLRVLRLHKMPNNEYKTTSDGQWTKLVCRINEHQHRTTTGV